MLCVDSAPGNNSGCCCHSYGLLSSVLEIHLKDKNTKMQKRTNHQNKMVLKIQLGDPLLHVYYGASSFTVIL